MKAKEWKSSSKSKIAIILARIFIFFFFYLVPALIVIGREDAKGEEILKAIFLGFKSPIKQTNMSQGFLPFKMGQIKKINIQ